MEKGSRCRGGLSAWYVSMDIPRPGGGSTVCGRVAEVEVHRPASIVRGWNDNVAIDRAVELAHSLHFGIRLRRRMPMFFRPSG